MSEAVVLSKSVKRNAFISRASIMLMICCLLGLGLRLFGIANESLWLDEATSLILVRMPLNELGVNLLKEDVHPPLYFTLLHFWLIGGEDVIL